ncbi:hypothetical protein GCM10027290_01860 [Micromonospora sonneratiae]|uniref:Uncharacterized protein n=1 Tax=Micromonospora sonneratiae TaxID=1184706 RepID=A0ABW3Y8S4_9ACTN
MSGALDLTGLDATEVSWSDNPEKSTDLYAVAPAGSISVTEGANDGRSCCGGGCGGRPIQWCCINCH